MRLLNLLLSSAWCVDYHGYKKVEISLNSAQSTDIYEILNNHASVNIWSENDESVTFSVSEKEYENIFSLLGRYGIIPTITNDDIQQQINNDLDRREHRRGNSPSTFAYDEYLDYDEYMNWIDHVAEDHGGLNISVKVMGKTHEGRDIPALVIPGVLAETNDNPVIVLDCGIHAREWISPAMCRLFIHEMMKCTEIENADKCNPIVRDHFYDYNWHILPMLNPDGYQYTWSNDRLWRKNRFPSATGPCTGTDLNRNSPVAWGTEGASDNSCSNTYRGDAPGSELEIQTLQNGFSDIESLNGGDIKAYVSLHSYSQKIISSYAVSQSVFEEDPPSIDQMNESGRRISEAMTAVHGTKYEYGQAREILYPSSGSTKDWVLREKNVPLAWTWELR